MINPNNVNQDISINVARSSMPPFEEFCNQIMPLWESRWLTNMGVYHKKLEKELIQYLQTPNITLYTNGHLALEYAIQALGLKGEIITTPFTFASTTQAIVRCGCTPVFCDIDADNYTMDPTKIESLITDKTSAIMPVHVYGHICDVDAIAEIADKYHLKVIYDAAHAFGVTYRGRNAANFGDISMFSFHATKVFHTIEGGALTYSDSSLVRRLDILKNFGIQDAENIVDIGGNAKMNEFQAAMGLCNLRHLSGEISLRKHAYERYLTHLDNVDGMLIKKPSSETVPNYAYFPVVFDGYKLNRDQVFDKLKENNIIARKYFYPLTTDFQCYKGRPGFDSTQTPVAKKIASQVLTLPLYAGLSDSDVDRICSIILE
jgi:dTDP-4-amino-4,6-dideoxygalactose transaminase